MGIPFEVLKSLVEGTSVQVGVIVHGGGVDLENAEFEAEIGGLACVRYHGYTELHKMPKTA